MQIRVLICSFEIKTESLFIYVNTERQNNVATSFDGCTNYGTFRKSSDNRIFVNT